MGYAKNEDEAGLSALPRGIRGDGGKPDSEAIFRAEFGNGKQTQRHMRSVT